MNTYKFKYYIVNTIISITPSFLFKFLSHFTPKDLEGLKTSYIMDRVDYYNKLNTKFSIDKSLPEGTTRKELGKNSYNYYVSNSYIKNFKKTGGRTYYFDALKVIKRFDPKLWVTFYNGDIRHIPSQPGFLKSRPISDNNQNSILLKLNEIRHFKFINDNNNYRDKKDLVVWRGAGGKQHRHIVIEKYYNHPMCNIGRTKPINGSPLEKPTMTIDEQLEYKFILAIEGNDVATNLKWAMSSNSLVIMSKPKYETWFMEGRLKAGVHYIEVADNYSDLIEKVEYYLENPNKAEKIIHNAHKWVDQFKDRKRERLISTLVANKYFEQSGQKELND